MAIDYYLEMATSWTVEEVAFRLHEIARKQALFDEDFAPGAILDGICTKLDTWIRVCDPRVKSWYQVHEEMGFTSTVDVAFRQGKFTDTFAQTGDMVRLVSSLFDEVPGDAALRYEDAFIMLERRSGELVLNERDDIWPPELLAAVHQPYRRAQILFLDETDPLVLDLTFEVVTLLTVEQVAVELHDAAKAHDIFAAEVVPELIPDGMKTLSDMWVRVLGYLPSRWKGRSAEDLGFTPTVIVPFRLGRSAYTMRQQDDVIRLVSGLLDRVVGDAVLHARHVEIWLLRRGGDLSLNERSDIWTPERLAAIGSAYRRATYSIS